MVLKSATCMALVRKAADEIRITIFSSFGAKKINELVTRKRSAWLQVISGWMCPSGRKLDHAVLNQPSWILYSLRDQVRIFKYVVSAAFSSTAGIIKTNLVTVMCTELLSILFSFAEIFL
jgi:hypothetical protein